MTCTVVYDAAPATAERLRLMDLAAGRVVSPSKSACLGRGGNRLVVLPAAPDNLGSVRIELDGLVTVGDGI